MDAVDFGPSAKTKMAANKFCKMYAMDILCERVIFRTVSPIDFSYRLEDEHQDFVPFAKYKRAAIEILKRMFKFYLCPQEDECY